jgi:hypothetical protein
MGGWKHLDLAVRTLMHDHPKLTRSEAEWLVLNRKQIVTPEEVLAKCVAAGGSCKIRGDRFHAVTPDGDNIEFITSPTGKPFVYSCDGPSEGWAYQWLASAGIRAPTKTQEEIAADLARADAYWNAAIDYHGTLGEKYLSKFRGITIQLDNVRFHEGMCALVARRQLPDDKPRGLIITYLKPNGQRDWRQDLGIKDGGVAIRLAPAGPKLLVGEGLETTASVMQRTQLPGWCCGTANDLKAVRLPTSVREVVVLQDNDPAGRRAAEDLYWRCRREGRIARIAAPPQGYNDWNDHHVGS